MIIQVLNPTTLLHNLITIIIIIIIIITIILLLLLLQPAINIFQAVRL